MSRGLVRSYVEAAIRELMREAGAHAADYLKTWLAPCTRLVWARLMLKRARERDRKAGVWWWGWRVGVLASRCDALDMPEGCRPEHVTAKVLADLERLAGRIS